MHTSSLSVSSQADRTAAANAARRASINRLDAEREARFQDLLSDRKTPGTPATADGAASDDEAQATVTHHAADEIAYTDAATGDATPASQTMQAVSVQQALLTAPPVTDDPADDTPGDHVEADGDRGTGGVAQDVSTQTPPPLIDPHGSPISADGGSVSVPNVGTKTPLIEPHGPPPLLDDGDDDDASLPTGGIKPPPIDPHGPPVSEDDGDPALTGVKPSLIAPHGPPPVPTNDPTTATGAQDKPPVIRPHGPPTDPTAQLQVGEHLATSGSADVTFQADPVSNASGVSPADRAMPNLPSVATVLTPIGQINPATPSTPTNGMAGNEYTTTIPTAENKPTDSLTANPPPTELPASTAFLVTTVAQAQFAANLTAGIPENPVAPGTATFSTPGAANLAARAGQASSGSGDRKTGSSSQDTNSERLKIFIGVNGTSVAKRQDSVMAYPSTFEDATEQASWSTPDAGGFGAAGLPDDWSSDSLRGRAKDGDAAGASAATASTPSPSSATTAQTPFAAAASAAPSTGIVQVDRMETLLQTIQQTAAQAQFDGTGQVELRVRLAGVADDVTVQVHLDENRQAQVSFQTGSPELRAALEQGWSDLTANASAAAASSPASAPDFSSTQPAANPAPADLYRDNPWTPTATASAATEQATPRWSGYA